MRRLISLLILTFFIYPVFSQDIKYERTFKEALAKALAQKKLVFLSINGPQMQGRIYTSGLSSPEAVSKYNENFICYQVSVMDTASYSLRKKYTSNLYPAYFFTDGYGNLVYKDSKNSTMGQRYIAMADSALKQAKSGKNLSDYDARYKAGNIDAPFLKDYIKLRQKLGIDDNAKLVEEYVGYLPISSLDNYQAVLFILNAGPIAYGRAYNLAYTNHKITDSIFKTEPLPNRIALNNRIIANTYKVAVATRNLAMMQQLSGMIYNTHQPDYRTGAKESTRYMINYYQTVKDTANYLRQASNFYDNYYMNISADSAKKLIEKQKAEFLKTMNKGGKTISADSMKKLPASGKQIITQSFSTVSSAQDVAVILNNAAYSFYTTGTRNANYINKAIIWSKRSIDLNPVGGFYDTLAHLLYRYGFYAEAEVDQNRAIALSEEKKQDVETKHLKEELVKMKNRTL